PQFHHVNDIVPTIYEVLGITPPKVVNGVPQGPFDGISLAYTFADAKAKGRKSTQFFDIMGSRGIYHDGWFAGTFGPRLPWVPVLHPEDGPATPYTEWTFSGAITRMPEFAAPKLGKFNNIVTMEVDVPANANGVLYALGGFSGGLSCFVKDGVLCYEYNLFEI